MLPLYRDPHFTFPFAEDRLVPRFHLEGVPCGQIVHLFWFDPITQSRLEAITTATVGDGGWVDLPAPLVVRAGQAFRVELGANPSA